MYHSLDLKFPASDPRAKDTRIIEAKIEHLNKIVEQILDFARTTEPKLAPVNLNELIDELGLLVRHKLANQNVRLVRDLQSNLPPVMGDAPQLEQAFLNLILNAAEAMPDGGTLTIKSHEIHLPRNSAQPTHVVDGIQGHRQRHERGIAKAGVHRRPQHHKSQGQPDSAWPSSAASSKPIAAKSASNQKLAAAR